MRISLLQLILTVLVLNGALAARAQELLDQKISVRLENQTVREALQTLEKKAHIRFVYSSQVVQLERKITLSVTEERLATVLDRLFRPLQIRYVVNGNQIAQA